MATKRYNNNSRGAHKGAPRTNDNPNYVRPKKALGQHFLTDMGVARKIAEGKLPEFWREIVGEHVANLTNDVRLERGILHVSVSSSVVRNDLFFRRDQLAQLINQRAGMQLVNAVIIR